MKAVGSVLGMKPPKQQGPDPAVLEAQKKQTESLERQEKLQDDERKNLQQKQNASLKASRARRAGGRSLLTGLETGVTREQLG